MNLSQYSTDDLYTIRDGCDEIENPACGDDYNKHNGLCWFLKVLHPHQSTVTYEVVREFIIDEEYEQKTPQGWDQRTILAGFIAAMIDDELIARGE